MRFEKLSAIFLFVLMAAMLVGVTGCGEDDDVVAPVVEPDSALPFPDTADQLMANFLAVYDSLDADQYILLLAPGFETHLQKSTMDEYPDVGPTLDHGEELIIHGRMFSGVPVTDPHGNLVPGVEAVSFLGWQRVEGWAVSGVEDIIPETECAFYTVNILLDRGQSYSYLKVDGIIKFYVTSRDSVHQGETRQFYQMVGQVDLTGYGKGVEDVNWGSVKALFR